MKMLARVSQVFMVLNVFNFFSSLKFVRPLIRQL